MINYVVGYGLLLTTPEGQAFKMYEQVVKSIKEIIQDNDGYALDWLLRLKLSRTSKHEQLILGIYIELDKTMDFHLIHTQWEESMQLVPEKIHKLLKKYGQNAPNIHILLGNS